MKRLLSCLLFLQLLSAHAELSTVKSTREHHQVLQTTTVALPTIQGTRLSQHIASHQQLEAESTDAHIETEEDIDEPDDVDTVFTDPESYRKTTDGKISFSHFSRIAFLVKTASKMYNFVAKLFPSEDSSVTDAEQLAKSFNSLRYAQQVFYIMYYDNASFGKEIELLYDQAQIIEFTFRDGLAFFGFDTFYAQICQKQNEGDALFKTLKTCIEGEFEDFKRTTLDFLTSIEQFRNIHKFIYSRLKDYEQDYTNPDLLVSDTDKIAQGKKMVGVFMNLKTEFDQMAQKIIIGVDNLFKTRTKVAALLKKMAVIDKMSPEEKERLILHYKPLAERGLLDVFGITSATMRLFVGVTLSLLAVL